MTIKMPNQLKDKVGDMGSPKTGRSMISDESLGQHSGSYTTISAAMIGGGVKGITSHKSTLSMAAVSDKAGI